MKTRETRRKQDPSLKEMARARLKRDGSYDGVFWVCVKTTGVFCRPSCPARPPHEENVHYAFTVAEAVAAGFRACKRCRPMETEGQPAPWMRRLLKLSRERCTERLTDSDLRVSGIDPVLARRHFRRAFGMTFHAYHRRVRLGGALRRLKGGQPPLPVALDSGYESDGGFRDAFAKHFHATPGRSGDVRSIVVRAVESPIGLLQLGATERGLCLLEFADRQALPTELASLEKRFKRPIVPGDSEFINQAIDELAHYFSGSLREFQTPLDVAGTAFQKHVWNGLCQIRFGQTTSYGELAKRVGRPGAQRAIGQANGANHLAIMIPCHRVVQANGKLRGYGGGLWRKQFLLDLEVEAEAEAVGRVPQKRKSHAS